MYNVLYTMYNVQCTVYTLCIYTLCIHTNMLIDFEILKFVINQEMNT